MGELSVIDLGEDRESEPEPARRPRDLRWLRAVVVLAVALVLAGSAPTGEPKMELLGLFPQPVQGSGTGLALAGGLVLVSDGSGVVAYNVDGAKRWAYQPSDTAAYAADWVPERDLILVNTFNPPGTVGLDPVTGAQRWRVEGELQRIDDLLAGNEGPELVVYAGEPPSQVWRAGPFYTLTLDTETRTAFGLQTDGTLTEYELATGKPIRTGKLPMPGRQDGMNLRASGDYLYLMQWSLPGQPAVYDRGTLTRIPDGEVFLHTWDCGPINCGVSGMTDERPRISAIDKTTGALLWVLPPERSIVPTPAGPLLIDESTSVTLGLVDPLTGVMRVQIEDWSTFGGDVLVKHYEDRSFIALLGPQGLTLVGSIPYLATTCQYEQPLLLCELLGNKVGVWRLNP